MMLVYKRCCFNPICLFSCIWILVRSRIYSCCVIGGLRAWINQKKKKKNSSIALLLRWSAWAHHFTKMEYNTFDREVGNHNVPAIQMMNVLMFNLTTSTNLILTGNWKVCKRALVFLQLIFATICSYAILGECMYWKHI